MFDKIHFKQFSGLDNISNININDKTKCKEFLTKLLEKKQLKKSEKSKQTSSENVLKQNSNKFDDKLMYNHIKFFEFYDIKIQIRLNLKPKSLSEYKTEIYYKNELIHKCVKNYEVYFNFKILNKLKENDMFKFLFDSETGVFNDKYILIDKNGNKSTDRLDMKIIFDDNISFGLEYFEKHHDNSKNDPKKEIEIVRLRRIIDSEKIKFVFIFSHCDIMNNKKFNKKFNLLINECSRYLNANNKKQYCVNELIKHFNQQKICEQIYDSYLDKNKCAISIKYFNDNLIQFKNTQCKKNAVNSFKQFIVDCYQYYNNLHIDLSNNDEVADLINSTSLIHLNDSSDNSSNDSSNDSSDDSSNDSSDDSSDDSSNDSSNDSSDYSLEDIDKIMTRDEYIEQYYKDDELTFIGFNHYISQIREENLLNVNERLKLNNYHSNIFKAYLDGLGEQFDDMQKLYDDNKIFGLDDL
jgi:hypothetical protein